MSQKNSYAITVLTWCTAGLCLAVLGSSIAFQATAWAEEMPAAEAQAWAKSYDPATKRRFIPVELWTGAPWSGKHEIVMGKADLDFGNYRKGSLNKQVRGPKEWRHNVTNKLFKIYDRRVESRDGSEKIQYFTVRDDKQGIGRVYDSRRSFAYLSPAAKFPLGYWTQGETRTLTAKFLRKAYKETGGPPLTDLGTIDQTRAKTRGFEMTIKDLHYTYAGVKHCLRFHWRRIRSSRKRSSRSHEYIYCPRLSMVETTILGRKKRAD